MIENTTKTGSSFDSAFCIETFSRLLETDSTTGQYEAIQRLVCEMLDELGYSYQVLHKGGVIAVFEGPDHSETAVPAEPAKAGLQPSAGPIAVTAHLDDIGLMVRHINADGTLNVCPVGGLYPFYCVMENVRVYTHEGKVITGTVCRTPNSVHVTEEELRVTAPDFRTNVCVVLDEPVKSAEETRALGVETGDMIALEPRFTYVNGYLKSRFIDDKACAALLLTLMKEIKEKGLSPRRKIYFYFAFYEEIGHGTTFLPSDVRDILAVDIAPTGPDQNSDEQKVSIFAKDSRFPYHYGMTRELQDTAIRGGVNYVMDIFTPHYGTDADGSVLAGYDVRHAAIGPGTANSHGYERTHIDGLRCTYELLRAYLFEEN